MPLFAILALLSTFAAQHDGAVDAQALVQQLSSDDVDEREGAARRLKELGRKAIVPLEHALKSLSQLTMKVGCKVSSTRNARAPSRFARRGARREAAARTRERNARWMLML